MGKVIGIVGSMRFRGYMDELERHLIREGHTPIAPTHAFLPMEGNWSPGDKIALEGLHLRKLALCDSVWVVDPGGYRGEATKKEIAYAESLGLEVNYMSDTDDDEIEQAKAGQEANPCICKRCVQG